MPRNKTNLGARADARIVELIRAGGTAKSIHAVLAMEGVDISLATIGRRIQSLRSGGAVSYVQSTTKRTNGTTHTTTNGNGARTTTTNGITKPTNDTNDNALPATPDEIPDDADLKTLDRWIARAEEMGERAIAASDLAALARAGRLSTMLLEAKRKATPLRAADQNENPDMQKLGGEVAERLHRLLDKVIT